MSELVLMGNIGAEEHAGAPPLTRARPAIQHLAHLWQSVMPMRARFLSEKDITVACTPPRSGAWPWLPHEPGLLPWLSTPSAEKRARQLNLPLLSPASAIIDVVHDKYFALTRAQELGCTPEILSNSIHILPDVRSPEEGEAIIRRTLANSPPWVPHNFTIKPRRGTSGRGRIPGYDGRVTPDMGRGLYNLTRQGGAILEPWLKRHRDLSAQLYVGLDGKVETLATTTQLLSASGIYQGNLGCFSPEGLRSGTSHDEQLIQAASSIGKAAAEKGFFGPCGIDAFVFADPTTDTPTLRPVVEFNARYTTATAGLAHLIGAFPGGRLPSQGGWLFILNASDSLKSQFASDPNLRVEPWYSPGSHGCSLLVFSDVFESIEQLAHQVGLLSIPQ